MSKNILEPLDIEEFIKKNKLEEVTSENTFVKVAGKKVLDPDGVYSERIFGTIGSSKRRRTFAYISFPKPVLNLFTFEPVSSNLITSIFGRENYQKFILEGKPLYLLEDGSLYLQPFHEDKDLKAIKTFQTPEDFYNFLKNEQNTVEFQTFYNYQNTVKGNKDVLEFILQNIDKIFTTKILVIPAAYRDIFIKENVVQENPISKLYQYLIFQNKKLIEDNPVLKRLKYKVGDEQGFIDDFVNQDTEEQQPNQTQSSEEMEKESDEDKKDKKLTVNEYYSKVHNALLKLANELVNILGFGQKGKLIRGAKLSKRLDHTVRLVLAHNKELKPNQVQIPWTFLIKLYEPFVLHHILKNSKYSDVKNWVVEQLGGDEKSLSDKAFRDLANNIVKNPRVVPPQIKEKFIEMLDEIISGRYDNYSKRVVVIRHPVESSDSILGMVPVIDENDTYVARLPQTMFATLGADCDGDQINIYALHTPKANIELEKLDPTAPHGGAFSIQAYKKFRSSIDMDLALGIYEMTKEK